MESQLRIFGDDGVTAIQVNVQTHDSETLHVSVWMTAGQLSELHEMLRWLHKPKLNWTSEKPTKPGWYWFKSDTHSALVLLREGTVPDAGLWADEGEDVQYNEGHQDGVHDYITNLAGQWAGPILPPAEKSFPLGGEMKCHQ
jgi:hypothetical protein